MKHSNDRDLKVPTLSNKEALVLELLLRNPGTEMYALELVRDSHKKLKRGTIYVTLSRMEDKHFVESQLEERREDASGLPRRLYRATGFGKKIYEVWQLARRAGELQFARGGVL